MSDHSITSEEAIRRTLDASPEAYWNAIVAEIEAAGREVRHAVLLNHQAAHLLFWAKLGRDAAMTAIGQEKHHGHESRQV